MRALVLCGALAAAHPAAAGETSPAEPLYSETSPRFGADVNAYLTMRGTALGFDFETPVSELQFIKVGSGYGAAVRVTVVFRGPGDHQAGGDVWEDRFVVKTFAATREAGSRVRFHRDFSLGAGDYKIDVTLEDLNGGRTSKARGRVKVPAFGAGALGLGDLQFGYCGADSSFSLLPSRKFEANLEAFCVKGAVYDRRSDDSLRSYQLKYVVSGEVGDDLVKGDTTVTLGRGGEFYLHPNVRDLFLGAYAISVEVKEGSRSWRTARTFEVETLNLPRGQNYSTVVEILSYVATDQEYAELKKAQTDSTRAAEWEAFWLRRDPTPDTARNEAMLDFFRRVRYANNHFSGQTVSGWRTDQGHVYIRFGAPDQIEDRPATYYDPPFQIWSYFATNQRFVFADREGFGRYELVSGNLDR